MVSPSSDPATAGAGVPSASGVESNAGHSLPSLNETVEALVALGHDARSPQAFLRGALAKISQGVGALAGALEVRILAQTITELHAESEEQRAFWENTVEGALTSSLGDGRPRARLYQSKRSGTNLALVSAPLRGPEHCASGAIVFVIPCPSREHCAASLDKLASLAFLSATLVESLGVASSASEQAGTDALSSLRKVANFESTTELAFALTNKLRTRDGCESVALAQVVESRVELLAISGLDEITKKSPGVRCIQAAMEECRDLARPIVQQDSSDFPANVVTGSPLHERWRTEAKGAPVASIPILEDGTVVAVLSVRRSPHATFSGADLEEFAKLVGPYATTLRLVDRASRSLTRHASSVAAKCARELMAHGHLGLKLAVGGPLLLALWLLFGSMDYELTVPCTVTAAEARQIGMPEDGLLQDLYVVPGDRVKAGDILCQFGVSQQSLERDRLAGELAILEIEEGRALAANDPAAIQLARANRANVQANLDLVVHRIEAAKVRAPADGVVTKGDLRARLGDVFTKGEALFELSLDEGWKLDLRIPENEITDVDRGMQGRFSSHARPESSHAFQLAHVRPNAELFEGDNVYFADAQVDLDAEWLRSGMEGLAVIEVDRRAPWRVLFHGVHDWLSLHLWL